MACILKPGRLESESDESFDVQTNSGAILDVFVNNNEVFDQSFRGTYYYILF